MKTQTIIAIVSESYGIKHASIRMYFNGILCAFTFAESPKYFGRPEDGSNYEIWGTYASITAEGDGMRNVFDIEADEVIVFSIIGCYRIRKVKDGDVLKYGTNNYKGVYAEPISEESARAGIDFSHLLCYEEKY